MAQEHGLWKTTSDAAMAAPDGSIVDETAVLGGSLRIQGIAGWPAPSTKRVSQVVSSPRAVAWPTWVWPATRGKDRFSA